ncbi:amidase [Spiractinospora alimapuensis]|uniref:amidase n=1 Tax=Spiractinospora alimapuensis TaxID=2820884 RepID=UPI001F1F61D4|nr:amidase [Spiractinospora alimapuensis]QVQ51909.1 amidase [Spiractinospora alimapuensis]
MSEIHDLNAEELAGEVRAKTLSPVDITEHFLNRIDRIDDHLGAFITVTKDLALEQARNAEARVMRDAPEDLPALCGIPVPVKDLDMVAGQRWTCGSRVYADQRAPVDEEFVAALREAGAVFLGKTNTPEFGFPCYTENDIAPPTRTPWDLTRSAGGSSGGAAAAVATGLAPVAQGSDGGGSIRIPASACGVFGVKPTRGRISGAPAKPDMIGLSTTGPIARTVRDAATLLDAMSISRPGDYYTAPPVVGTFRDSADRDPGRLRVARFATPVIDGVEIDAEVRTAFEETSTLLAELGHDVVDIPAPFHSAVYGAFTTAWAAMATRYPLSPEDEERIRPLSRWLRERGRALSATEYLDATGQLQQAIRRALATLQDFDAVLTPTLAQVPQPLGHFDADGDPEMEFLRMGAFTPFAAMYNVSGQPAVSVPLHWTNDGLPIGSMLAGRMGGEPTLIALAAQLEQARPWGDRTPPLWDA